MGMPKFSDLAAKADLTVSDLSTGGGRLQEEQVRTFLKMVQDQPTILREARRVEMRSHTREVARLGFEDRVLRAAPASGTPLDAEQRVKPDLGQKLVMESKKAMAEIHLDYETLEDNIEGGRLESTIMALIAERVAIDLEELFLRGDSESPDPFLALEDGVLKRLAGQAVPLTDDLSIGKHAFKAAINALPAKYFRNRNQFRFYLSDANETEYRDKASERATGYGDMLLSGADPVHAFGVPVASASLMPEDSLLLTHPKNLLWGVQRDITIETDKDIRAQVYMIVVSLRVAVQIEDEAACVLITGIDNTLQV